MKFIFTNMSDEQLQRDLDRRNISIKDAEESLVMQKKFAAAIKAELDRRAIEAYWTAHPELLRVNVGDKVTLVQELFNRELSNYYEVNDEAVVMAVYPYPTFFSIKGGELELLFTMREIQLMRRAYLEGQTNAT